MKKIVFFAAILLLCCALVSCGLFGSKDKDPKDEDKTTGWVDVSHDANVVYRHLIYSIHRTLGDISQENVTNANPDFAIDLIMDMGLNGDEYTLKAKTKYKKNDAGALMMSAELVSKDTNTTVLGGYYGKPSGAESRDLYVKINDGDSGKLKFEMSDQNGLDEFFPIKNFDSSEIQSIAQALAAFVETKGSIKGKERFYGNIKEYQYSIVIDIPNTLRKLATVLAGSSDASEAFQKIFKSEEDRDAFERILSSVLGISIADLNSNSTFPNCSLSIDFATSDTKLTAFGVKFEVQGNSTSTLFNGESIELELSLNSIVIDKSYTKVSIPFFGNNEYQQYKKFISKGSDVSDISAYGISLNILTTDLETNVKENKKVRAEFSLSETESANEILFELLTPEDDKIWGLYLKNNTLYTYIDVDGEYQLYKHFEDVNAVDIFNRLKEDISSVTNNRLGVLEVISNIISATKINKDAIDFTVSKELIDVFIPDFADFLEYIDEALGENLNINDELEVNEVDVEGYLQRHNIMITIDFDKDAPFVYELEGEIDFGDYVD